MKYLIIVILTVIIVGAILAFKFKKGNLLIKNSDLVEAGQLLYPDHNTEFEQFFNSFLTDKNNFLTKNEELLDDYDNFELEKLRAIDVIYIFGDSKRLLWMTDWKGEENKRETEHFLEAKLQYKPDWANSSILRDEVEGEKQRDGEFIIDLLKAIDKDLDSHNSKLIFLNLNWDAYIYTVVDHESYKKITEKFGSIFHGTEKLRN